MQETGRHTRVSLEDFGGCINVADNSAALRAAIAALAKAGGGTLAFSPGVYNFASETLAGAGVELTGNIEIVGRGKGVTMLNITGTTSCYFFLNETNQSNQRFDGFTFRQNGQALGVGPGGFYYCSVLGGSKADVENVVITNVRLENCKADYWIRFYCTSATHAIRRCGIGKGCEAQSHPGNSRDPTNIGVNSAIIEFNGDTDGFVYDPFVEELWADLRYVKAGVICYSNVVRPKIVKPTLLDAFQGYAKGDKGGYAVQLYDATGIVTDAVVDTPTIVNPFCCGIYAAGTNGLRIIDPKISGQSDRSGATIPKAALALNGAVNCRVENPQLSDNFCDIRFVGPVETVGAFRYPSDVNLRVTGGYAENCTEDSVIINASPFYRDIGGIHFQGFKTVGAAGRGVLIQGNATHGFDGVDFTDCEVSATTYGFDINPSIVANHLGKNIRITGGAVRSGRVSIQSHAPSTASSVYVRGAKLVGRPGESLDLHLSAQ